MNDPGQMNALHSNAIPALILILKLAKYSIHAAAAHMLGNINLLKQACSESVKEGALPVLVNLLDSVDQSTPTCICRALQNICSTQDHAQALDAILPLVCLLSHKSISIKVTAASALSKIYTYVSAAISVKNQRIVPVATSLLQLNDFKVQILACLLYLSSSGHYLS